MRLAKLRETLTERELDAILVTQPKNQRYLSGFTGGRGVLLISAEAAIIVVDFISYEQAAREAPDFRPAKIKPGEKFTDLLPDLIAQVGAERVGFESAHLTVAQHKGWAEAAEGFELVPTKDIVEDLRAIKDKQELDGIRRAVALADEAFAYIVNFLRPGMKEREVAWELESFMRTHGAEKVAFDLIVASGPNGAMPHATPSEREIKAGEPIVMDLGCKVDSYNSDMTRTISLDHSDEKFQEIHKIVLKAQTRAEEAIKPGITGKEADEIAREVIEEAGYGEQFGHGLGHGVGLAVHEKPTLNKTSEDELKPGMVFTVEPGIYIQGWGGVRIEDMVVLGEDGLEVLTRATKECEVKR